MAGWQTKTLGEVLERTETVNPLQSPEMEFDYIDVSSVSNTSFEIEQTQRLKGRDAPSRARKLVKAHDVIFATIRPTLRRIAIVPPHLDLQVCSTGYFVLRPKSILDHRFMYYWLFAEEFMGQMEVLQKGASYPAVTDKEVRDQSIPFPPLPEQQRIVTLLDEAFDGIATAKGNAEKNLHNAKELFGSHLHTVFSQEGNGWTTKSVRQLVSEGVLAKPQDGNHGEIHPTKADYVEVGVPFIMAADLDNGAVNTEDCRFISDRQARTLRIGFAQSGDVLLSHKGTIGRIAVLESSDDYVVLTPQVTYYRSLDSKQLYNGFLYYCLLSPDFQSEMNRIAGAGSTRAYIGITRQLDLEIMVPPIHVQHEVTLKLRKIQETSETLVRIYEQKLVALDELKKSLLHLAFSGNL